MTVDMPKLVTDLAKRIVEMEDENTELRKQNEILATTRRLEEEARKQAEAELAELLDRRCDGCAKYHKKTFYCRKLALGLNMGTAWSCSSWQPREGGGR